MHVEFTLYVMQLAGNLKLTIFVWICYEAEKNRGNVARYIKAWFHKPSSMNYWASTPINLGPLAVPTPASSFHSNHLYIRVQKTGFFLKKCFHVESIDGDWALIELNKIPI